MDFVKTKTKKKTSKSCTFAKIKGIALVVLVFLLFTTIFYLKTPLLGRITLALVNNNVIILSLEKEKNILTIITFPEDFHLNVLAEKGQVSISKLFKLDQIEGYKGKLLQQTLRELLGIPIDGFLKIPSSYNVQSVDDFIKLRDHEFNPFDLNKKTNLSPIFLHRLYFQIRKVRFDKITIIDLGKSGILQKQILPDSSEVFIADTTGLDGIITEKFYEWKILDEHLTIAVFNGTATAGLAKRVSRIITNMGGNVVVVGDSLVKVVDCIINVSRKNQKSYTVHRLKKVFSCEIDSRIETAENSRADITLTIGSKYEKEIYGLQP